MRGYVVMVLRGEWTAGLLAVAAVDRRTALTRSIDEVRRVERIKSSVQLHAQVLYDCDDAAGAESFLLRLEDGLRDELAAAPVEGQHDDK